MRPSPFALWKPSDHASNQRLNARHRRFTEQRAREEQARRAAEYLEQREQQEAKSKMTMKQHIEAVNELRGTLTKMYREDILDKMETELRAVRNDDNLSQTGKIAKETEIRAKYQRETLKLAKSAHDYQKEQLEQASIKARSILDAPTTKADDLTIDRFHRQMNELKAEILLHPNPQTAAGKIAQLASSVDHPHLGELLRDEFANLIQPFAGSLGAGERRTLAQSLDGLKTRLKTDEQREAEQTLDFAQRAQETKLFGVAFEETLRGQFGPHTLQYVNDYDKLAHELHNEGEAASA